MGLFNELLEPNFVAWDAAVTACFRGGDSESSERLFESMPFKDSTSWNLMLAVHVKAGEMEMARKLGMRPNEVSLTGVLSSCAQAAFEFGRIVHGFVEKSGFSWIISVNNTLIST
ncbi:hypothetical protein QYF36_021088 [Acer negundo]|nr:hypothetical protein QYF36_021088 [Acer negundo]